MLAFITLRMLRKRIVYTVHDAMPHGDRRRISAWQNRQLYRLAHVLVVLSRQVGHDIQDWVLPGVQHKIHIIEHPLLYPLAVSPTREAARAELGLDEDAEMVLFFGGIEEYKGITDLIDGFAVACHERPNMILYVAGNPWDPWEKWAKQIDRLGVKDRVRAYPQYLPEEFKVTLYAACDISVLPHRDPSQSGMGAEALALGAPLIATRAGGLPDLVREGETGYLVPVRDPQAMGRAMLAFFGQSRADQRAMAEATRRFGLENFDAKVIGRKHMELYRAVAQPDWRPGRDNLSTDFDTVIRNDGAGAGHGR
jgi:glycosyltransferase involved in cell wall biosynthesis